MGGFLSRTYVLLGLQVVAFQPVWSWYVSRLTDRSDEPWGLLALITAVVFGVVGRSEAKSGPRRLIVPCFLMLVYCATYPWAPRLVRAALAVASLSCTLTELRHGRSMDAPCLGLFLLSLPILASVQFYLGYPLRVVTGTLAACLLQVAGLSVVREGACLRWGTDLVMIDAPCSGVHMLWASGYLTLVVAGLLKLGTHRTLTLLLVAFLVTIVGNGLRSAALFQLEAGIVSMPSWCHEAAGVVVFASTALFLVWFSFRLGRSIPCATRICT